MKLKGFIDSHMHFLGLGYVSENIDLSNTKSITEIINILKDNLNRKILIGRGWNQANLAEKRMLTKNDLNAVSKDIPIIMTRVCGHVLTCNDKMLEIANIDKNTNQIPGGTFDYQTGIFTENALSLISDYIPNPTIEDLERYMIKADKMLLENGITAVASDDFSTLNIPFETIINLINRLYDEDKIQVKITEQVNLPLNELKDFIRKGYVNRKFSKLKMGPLKILTDGSLGGKTAFLREPYEQEPNNIGINSYTDDELFEIVHLANQNNMDIAAHAIGDGAVQQFINAIIKSTELTKRYNHNHAIIHAQLATNDQIELMKRHNIGAIVQPIFLNSDINIISSRIGERANESYLFYTMYKQGLNVGFSTDAPIEPVSPFKNIYSAVKRKSIKHKNFDAFLPNESYNLTEALECYTTNNLKYVYEKNINHGDYIIINKDITEDNLLEIKVEETYIDNKLVYSKNHR